MQAVVPSLLDLLGAPAELFGTPEPRARQLAALDAFDRDGALHLIVDLPGVGADDVEVLVDEHTVTVRAERRIGPDPTDRVLRQERPWGNLERRVRVERALDRDTATSELVDGVLTVKVPYVDASAGPRRVPISGSSTAPSPEEPAAEERPA